MSPSSLEWWQWWLAGSISFGLAWLISQAQDEGTDIGCTGISVMIVGVLAGIFCLVIAMIRFIKWVWA